MLLRVGILALMVGVAGFAAAKTRKTSLTPEQRGAQSLMKTLSLRDKVAQLVIGVCYGDAPGKKSAEFQKYRHWVHDLHIGGLIVNNRVHNGLVRNAEPHAMALFLNQMQKMSKVPLMVGADFERGASMRVSSGARFPFNMAFAAARDLEGSRFEGQATAQEARALGVQWIFAPVADVNNNPANPVINTRSYGENPEEVAEHVAAYIEGAHSVAKNRVLVTAKHFPGHGDTNIDSHLGLARLEAGKERMLAVELKPFETAIAHGADAIMTAHLAVPALEPDDIPATASPKILTALLRQELGFNGIIVTDAMDMQGFTKQFNSGEGSIRALEAGADVLLMPPSPEQAIRAVVGAVENGRLTRQRIEASVLRVLAAKIRVGLVKKRLVDLDEISDVLDSPETAERAQAISDRAITLLRNERGVAPLASANQSCLVVVVERRLSQLGQRMITEFHKRAPQAKVTIVDPTLPGAALAAAAGDASGCSAIVVAVFATGELGGDLPGFVEHLAAAPAPVVLVAMGSPYVLSSFPRASAYIAAFSATPPSETSVVRALFGEIAITGHVPVTIPGLARYGDGIQMPARTH